MKIIGVQFSDSQKLKIDDLAKVLNVSTSQVARAAMKLGLEQITGLSSIAVDLGKDLVLINDARAK